MIGSLDNVIQAVYADDGLSLEQKETFARLVIGVGNHLVTTDDLRLPSKMLQAGNEDGWRWCVTRMLDSAGVPRRPRRC
jgi:hypothetical protein